MNYEEYLSFDEEQLVGVAHFIGNPTIPYDEDVKETVEETVKEKIGATDLQKESSDIGLLISDDDSEEDFSIPSLTPESPTMQLLYTEYEDAENDLIEAEIDKLADVLRFFIKILPGTIVIR